MSKRFRFAALFLAVIILFMNFAAVSLIFHEQSHNCKGEGCPVCAAIITCENLLKSLFSVALSFLFITLLFVFSKIFKMTYRPVLITPVSLKVKMTN